MSAEDRIPRRMWCAHCREDLGYLRPGSVPSITLCSACFARAYDEATGIPADALVASDGGNRQALAAEADDDEACG